MTGALALVAALAAAIAGLPETPLPANHPSTLPDALFTKFHEQDGIVIRTATVDGLTVVRSTTLLPAQPDLAAGILADVVSWSGWVKRLESSKRLDGDPPAFWLRFDAPWPFADRDYAIVPAVSKDAAGNQILWWESGASRLPPPGPHTIRVTNIRGGIVFLPGEDPGTTRIVYTDVAVLGGKLPRWAIRESYRRGPVGILGALRRKLTARLAVANDSK